MIATRKTLLHGISRHLRLPFRVSALFRPFSSGPTSDDSDPWSGTVGPTSGDWENLSSWSTGLTKDHFDGTSTAIGRKVDPKSTTTSPELAAVRAMDEEDEMLRSLEEASRGAKRYVDSWPERFRETAALLKQVRDPGVRGSYLKDSEKKEMYRLHKKDPETYTVERLAKDFRVMRQRVHVILWFKEMEEEEERKQGKPLDDSIDNLLDSCPE